MATANQYIILKKQMHVQESPRCLHPAIRRASWNPDAGSVAGKACVKQPRKGGALDGYLRNTLYNIIFQCPVSTWRCPLSAKCQPFQQMKLLWRSKMSCFRRLIKMKFSSGENSMVSRESSIEGQNDMKSQKEGWIFDISHPFLM